MAAVVGSQYTVSPTITNAFHMTYQPAGGESRVCARAFRTRFRLA